MQCCGEVARLLFVFVTFVSHKGAPGAAVVPNKGAYGAEQGSIRCQSREHTVPNKGAYGAVCSQGSIWCRTRESLALTGQLLLS